MKTNKKLGCRYTKIVEAHNGSAQDLSLSKCCYTVSLMTSQKLYSYMKSLLIGITLQIAIPPTSPNPAKMEKYNITKYGSFCS